jgi:hypothetical protein
MKRPVRPALLLLCGVTSALLLAGCPKRPMTSPASAPAPTVPSSTAPTAPTPPARPAAAAAAVFRTVAMGASAALRPADAPVQ